MKKIFALFVIAALIVSTLTGCGDKTETAFEEQLSSDLQTIYDDLANKLPDTSDVESQKTYLLKWAGARGIPVSYDKNNNIIMSKKAVSGYEDVQGTIFQCTIGTGELPDQYEAISTALYLLEKAEQHGFIRVLFTAATENEDYGAQLISSHYLKNDYLISLTGGPKTYLTIGGAGSSEYLFSKPLTWAEPTYPNAYEISIKGLLGGSSEVTSGSHPNPIKIIGDFLASAKSKGVLIELASFNGGETAGNYPTNATAVILINDNDVARFEKWFENDSSKFEDKYKDTEENYTYTLTPVERPLSVISKEDSTKVLSFMYTMINGIYTKSDDGEILAVSNIGTISTTTGNLDATICARSLKEELLQEISSTFEVICGLNEISYSVTAQTPIWLENEESPLYLRLNDVFLNTLEKKVKHRTTMENTECAIFKSKNPNLDVLSMSINFENGVTEIQALKDFLENLNTEIATAQTESK